jgi:hypothetical protein
MEQGFMKRAGVTWLAMCSEHGSDSSRFVRDKEILNIRTAVTVTRNILLQGIRQVNDMH